MSRCLIFAVAALAACGDNTQPDNAFCDSWYQWGSDPAHSGQSCVSGQLLNREFASVVIDPYTAEEQADSTGDLVIHYQTPLIDGDAVFMLNKGGTYTPCDRAKDSTGTTTVPDCFESDELYRLNSETWTESRYEWQNDQLVPMWTFTSDWKPEPGHYFEPVFQPALVADFIAIPGEGGSVWELDATTGAVVRYIAPFQTNPDVYVAGALAVHQGSVFYNAIHLDHNNPAHLAAEAWLVAVAPDGSTQIASYADLVPGAPDGDATCSYPYSGVMIAESGYPPMDADGNLLPAPTGNCGRQMPGLNAAPAFAENGTMFVATHAQYDEYYSYVVSIDSDSLTPNWATSLRGLVSDGCDVTTTCSVGAVKGLDPTSGLMPAMLVDDDSTASPVALPDGGVLYGSYSSYNSSRGHLLHFNANGALLSTFDFGWDSTPAVLPDGSIIEKDNHYGTDAQGHDAGPYYVTKLNPELQPVWRFTSTDTQSCSRAADGTVTCVDDHPNGFEWCINAPAVDRDSVSYLNSEDGNLYAIDSDGNLRDWFFLGQAIGAAYTPVALDHLGRVYALNAGHLIVVGL